MTFNVSGDTLNGILNQRSNDMLTANNWNVVQYAILMIMFAQVSGLKVGELVHVIADAHIYDRHIPMVEEIIKEKGWIQISDEGAIKEVVLKILEANPQSIVDYKGGKDKALGFLVGQAMKETKGKANPQMLNKMFLEELNKIQ